MILITLASWYDDWARPYLNYCQALEEQEPERIVYLAIPVETYEDFFQLPFIQRTLGRYQVKRIIYDPKQGEIKQWIN